VKRFEGSTVLVTGASRGLGRTLALAFADEGAYVFAGYRAREEDAAETARLLSGRGERLRFDVTQPEAVEAAFATVRARKGRLDVLVNNAGATLDGPAALMDRAQWRGVLDVNLDGAFQCTRGAIPLMLGQRTGAILNLASVAGLRASPGQANYSASKGGLLALTRTLAAELAPRGIRVNALVPGLIETGIARHLDRRVAARMVEATPLGRAGKPEEVARAALFLCSEEASFIVGHALVVDGGLTA
jgi:3-oxoacyl-[acyl-carrier protein] reductase